MGDNYVMRKIRYELGAYAVTCTRERDGSWIASTGRTGNAIGSSSDAVIAESLLRIADQLEEDAARVQEEANEIRVNVRAAFGRDPEAIHVRGVTNMAGTHWEAKSSDE